MFLSDILWALRTLRCRLVALIALPLRIGGIPWHWTRLHGAGLGANRRRVDRVRLWPGSDKVIVKSFATASAAREAYEHQRIADSRLCNVVAPTLLSGPGRLFVMPSIDGVPAMNMLRQRSFEQVFRGPIAWLRDLHDLPCPRTGFSDLPAEYDRLLSNPNISEHDWLVRQARIWHDHARALGPRGATRVHGDFHGGNILVSAEDFQIIDFNTTQPGLPELDLAQFLAHFHAWLAVFRAAQVHEAWPRHLAQVLDWYGDAADWSMADLAGAIQLRRLVMAMRTSRAQPNPARAARLAALKRKLSVDPADYQRVFDP